MNLVNIYNLYVYKDFLHSYLKLHFFFLLIFGLWLGINIYFSLINSINFNCIVFLFLMLHAFFFVCVFTFCCQYISYYENTSHNYYYHYHYSLLCVQTFSHIFIIFFFLVLAFINEMKEFIFVILSEHFHLFFFSH